MFLPFSDEQLTEIYDKNQGYCYYCGRKLAFTNYGIRGAKGAWHVEHKVPKSKGGTDYPRNLTPACVDCNEDKSDMLPSSYKKHWEPATMGGQFAQWLGLPEGAFGSARRKRWRTV